VDDLDSGAWTGHRRGSPEYKRLLAALFFAGIATFAQLYSPQAALPQIALELRAGPAGSALTISAATIGLAIGVLPWSVIADRRGRVRTMSISVSAATVFGLLVPFAPNLGLLLTGRMLEGLMLGGVPAIAIAYLSEEIESGSITRAAGSYVAGTTIGGLAGRVIAGPIADVSNWRVGVLAVAIVCSIAAVLFIRLVPAQRGFRPRGVAAGGNPPADHASRGHRLAVNLRSPRLLALYAQAFLLMGGFVALYNFIGFRLAAPPFNIPQALISLLFFGYLAGTWSAARAGAVAARRGRLPVLTACVGVMIVGVLVTIVDSAIAIIVGLVIATVGFFGAHAVASGWVGTEATIGRTQAASLYTLFYYGGSSLFGWLGGIFFVDAGWGGTTAMIIGLAVIAGGLALLALRTSRHSAALADRR
jgi:predicted MFS family arabinose efflux permease